MKSGWMQAGKEKVCALTGAYGYVGSRIGRALEADGWRVLALSRRSSNDSHKIPWSLGGQHCITEELRCYSVAALVHAAWDFTQVRANDIERVNVQGSLRLFEQAVAAGVSRVVFVSSMSAYPEARSLYGKAKMAVEVGARKFPTVTIRPGLVFGDQPGGVFAAMQRKVDRSSIIPLIGDGSYPQYMVHEEDVGAAVVSALGIVNIPPEPVNVAHPQPWPFRKLVERIVDSRKRHVRLVAVPVSLVLYGLKLTESLGLRSGFRSDSVVSLLSPNPHPEFNCVRLLGVYPRPFQ